MSRVQVVTDSATDLPADVNKAAGIEVVPLKIRFEEKEYVDGVELSKEEFWALSAQSSTLPQTSAPSVGEFKQTFQRIIDSGCTEIICVTLSSELSATHQSAVLAAQEFKDTARIAVLDSRTVSIGEGVIALELAKLAQGGTPFDLLVSMANTFPQRSRTFGALDTLENLKKGGRIGAAQALVGSLLSFKPVIEITNGVVQAESRQRTRSRAISYLIDKVKEYHDISHLAVIHAQAPDFEEFTESLRAATGIHDILTATMGPIIGTHAGPRTVGISFWTEETKNHEEG